VPSVTFPANGIHNALYVVSEHDSAMAFDADTGRRLWHLSLLGTGETPSDDRGCSQVTRRRCHVHAGYRSRQWTARGPSTLWRCQRTPRDTIISGLHALDLTTGPRASAGRWRYKHVPRYGAEGAGGTLTFDPKQHKERAALTIVNGVVYTSWSSHWTSPVPLGDRIRRKHATASDVLNLTPNGSDGGLWGSGAGRRLTPVGTCICWWGMERSTRACPPAASRRAAIMGTPS